MGQSKQNLVSDSNKQESVKLKLKIAEVRYRNLFENAPFFIGILNEEGILIECNNVVKHFLSIHSKTDLIGKSFEELLSLNKENMKLIPKFKEYLNRILSMKNLDPFEIQLNKTLEGKIWCSIQCSLIKIDKEDFIQVLMQNITKTKSIEEKLKKSKEKYHHLFEDSPNAIIIGNSQGKVMECNSKALNLFGYEKEEVVGKDFGDFPIFSPEDLIIALKDFKNLLKGEKPKPREFNIYKKDGSQLWVLSTVSIVRYNNEIIYQIIIQDISEKKKAEKIVSESGERYRLITENANDLIALLNDKLEFEYINENVHKNILGYTKEDLIGSTNLELIHPEDRKKTTLAVSRILRKGEGTHQLRFKTKNGRYKWLEVTSKNFYDSGGNQKVLNISRDITERKEIEESLKKNIKRMEILNRIIVSANDAHDIDQLLEGILNTILNLMNFDGGGIYLVDHSTRTASIVVHKGLPLDFIRSISPVKIDQDYYKNVFIDKELLISENFHKIDPELAKKWNIRSIAGIPLLFKNEVIGTLNIASTSRYSFSNEEKVIFQSLGREIGNVIARMKAEGNLKESENKFRSIVESIPMGLHMYDLNSNGNLIFTGANPTADKILNVDNSQFIGKTIEEAFPPLTETEIPDRYRKAASQGASWKWDQVSYEDEKIEGAYEVHAFQTSPGKMVAFFTDITDRLETERKLRESEDMFRNITEQSFMGIGIIKEDKIIYANEAVAKILEYPLDEIMTWTKSVNILNMIHPEDLQPLREQRKIRREGDFNQKPNISYRIITKSGRIKWIDQYSKIILYHGKDAELISIIDITEKKHAEEIILQENLKLLELNKMRKDIITRVSHELKTPLTSIYGASQILLKHFDGKIDEDVLKFIEIFHRGALRLKKLVENLIDASRIESGKLELNVKMNDLVKITKECVEEMSYLLDSRKLIVNLYLPDELEFNVDKIRLQQVITNLLSNAIKNTPINGRIFVNLVDHHDYIDIHIKDTGIGITEKEKELLFEKFGKMERYGMDLGVDIEGSGLGLYISKEIVELHGGQIHVESEGRNKGSTFTIRLF